MFDLLLLPLADVIRVPMLKAAAATSRKGIAGGCLPVGRFLKQLNDARFHALAGQAYRLRDDALCRQGGRDEDKMLFGFVIMRIGRRSNAIATTANMIDHDFNRDSIFG
jgi:hypothetical protein